MDLPALARLTEGLVGSHIAFLCKRAAMLAIADVIQGRRTTEVALRVTTGHFQAAIEELRRGHQTPAH